MGGVLCSTSCHPYISVLGESPGADGLPEDHPLGILGKVGWVT